MSTDTLLAWASKPASRRMMSMVGLPTPQPLKRGEGPWVAQPLSGQRVVLGGSDSMREVIAGLGAEVVTDTEEEPSALVYDARGVATAEGLKGLYDFFHPRIRGMGRCGRVVVIGHPAMVAESARAASASEALLGFVKSISKEIGRKGSTANLLTVVPGAESGLAGPLRFLLSPRSAFVTGQALSTTSGPEPCPSVQPLVGKTALVTGAARGIGRATARRLAEEGARVIVLDIPPESEALDELAADLDGVALALDITDTGAASDIATAAGGCLDILVHNAGVTRDKTLAKMDEERWDLTIDVNLASVIAVTETLLSDGTIPEGGRIVLVSSIAGIAGNAGQTNYAASKSGIVGLTRHLGCALADRDIAVNAVAPGFIETRLTHAIPFTIREVGRRFSNLNQGGLPVDVAEAITFLSSPGAGGLHGNVLRVCGGNLLGA